MPRPRNDIAGYEDITTEGRVSLREYLRKLKRSAVAFNTPAVLQCHGWKLGEYLALGKAIISTPLTRQMPAPLVHGEQIHFVDGSPESIRAAVQRICGDRHYRRHLEQRAREYYLAHLQPERVIQRILEMATPTASLPGTDRSLDPWRCRGNHLFSACSKRA